MLRLRIVVLVLLALAIPVQGMAAVSAAQCMAFGHHDNPANHGHTHAQDHADGDEHAAHSHDNHDGNDTSGKAAHCGPCVACCTSASIAGHVEFPLLPSRSEGQHLFTQFPPLGVQPDGLDRPPLAL